MNLNSLGLDDLKIPPEVARILASRLFPKQNDSSPLHFDPLEQLKQAIISIDRELTKDKLDTGLLCTKEEYASKEEYVTTLTRLVQREENYQQQAAENWTLKDILITWKARKENPCAVCLDVNVKKCPFDLCEFDLCGSFELPEEDKRREILTLETKLRVISEKWNAEVDVDSIDAEGINFICKKGQYPPPKLDDKFTVKQSFSNFTYDRLKDGLSRFKNNFTISEKVISVLLGRRPSSLYYPLPSKAPIDTTILDKFNLNISQRKAAIEALGDSAIYLILGPPGTGKTKTSVAIISQLLHQIKSQGNCEKILVCGPSNTAVDNLTLKLCEAGIQGITRIYAAKRENSGKLNPEIKAITLSVKAQEKDPMYRTIETTLRQKKFRSDKERKQYRYWKKETEKKVLMESSIVCCTCSTAADVRLKDFVFKNVFIDEAAQSIEPETLLPLMLGAERVLLAGDHKQLGPVITCEEAKCAGLEKSLFERLLPKVRSTMLECQYRMHPLIAEFPSNTFYEGQLKTDPSVQERHKRLAIPLFKEKSAQFFNTQGEEEKFGTSWRNRTEAYLMEMFLEKLFDQGVRPENIGIITPYAAQKDLLKSNLGFESLKIASVDEFQGGEKDYIILSTVRSNSKNQVGFLDDERRLNVAITRARYGLAIFGDAGILENDLNWRKLIGFLKEKECFFNEEKSENEKIKIEELKNEEKKIVDEEDDEDAELDRLLGKLAIKK